jgi:hypothetical protein
MTLVDELEGLVMPWIAHSDGFILGVGSSPKTAEQHMRRFHADLDPVVEPATKALVASVTNDPFRPDYGDGIVYGEFPLGAILDGIHCLPEERLAVTRGRACGCFQPDDVQSELKLLQREAASLVESQAQEAE